MRSMRAALFCLLPSALLSFCSAGVAEAKTAAIERAERAIEAKSVDPERDIQPLLDALESSRSVDEKRELVGAIADFGEVDGSSPNSVKQYLAENAPSVLLEVIRSGADNFLQGDAVHALRGMNVPRSVLEQAAAIARADPDSYVQSRGEILENYIAGLPKEIATPVARKRDPTARNAGVAYLDQLGIVVSTESLRQAARRADPKATQALLDAGVAADTGAAEASQTPLYFALSQACSSQGAETDWLVETVRLLLAAGADANRLDDNRNPPLIHAAQYCGPKIVGLLVDAGARVDVKNGSGVKPLALALILSRFETAEALIGRGARLDGGDRTMVSGVTDPRGKALVQKAMGKSSKP
ncbi:MAG: ankyrin repeat domain-containing protein [Thermoanaerobaculia bacterium]